MTDPKPAPRANSFKARVIAMKKADPTISYQEIVDRVGCSMHYAKWVCQKNGFLTRQPHRSIKTRYFDLRKRHPEWSAHRIAKEMGVNPNSIYLLMKRCDTEYVSISELGKAARAAGLTIEKIKQMGTSDARHA